MRRHIYNIFLILLILLTGCSASVPQQPSIHPPTTLEEFRNRIKRIPLFESFSAPVAVKAEDYWDSSECSKCHSKLYTEYSESMHGRSFENPVFQALYFKDLVPRALKEQDMNSEARTCISCHAPIASLTKNKLITSKGEVPDKISGVTCDFCHTIKGYKGLNPGDANYIAEPGNSKFGPFKYETAWHHVYSSLYGMSSYCAICHQRTNGKGLEIISTFREWQESSYANRGVQCQDCHMNINGFLKAGRPAYDSGKVAEMWVVDTQINTEEWDRLFTHRFPGAHSMTQVTGALTLDIEMEGEMVLPGDEITLNILVDNSRSGHKMPTGSAELRLLWLEVRAGYGEKTIPVRLVSAIEDEGYDAFNKEIAGNDISEGSRVYRAVLVDEAGKQTSNSYDAVKIIFDNRLNASEVRKEQYRITIPEDAAEGITLKADLYYLQYPDDFAKRLKIPEAQRIEIASEKMSVSIGRNLKPSE